MENNLARVSKKKKKLIGLPNIFYVIIYFP